MLNSITNMGKKTKKKAAPPPPPLNSGQRVRFGSAEGYVSKVTGDTYDVALDGGKVIQAARDKLEPIHRRLSAKPPSNKLSATRSSTELDYRGTNFEDFPDEALPLIEVSDDKEVLTVNEEAVELLRRIDCAICPISIVGLYRTGKSSLLNFLHGGKAGFRTGHSVSRCTRGVWIYGRPTRATLGDGTQVAVVLLDTEGVGGLEADRRYDERIFALATLLSATLVYNSLGSIDENAIGQLSFVAQLSRHVRFAPKEDASVDDGDEAEEDARRLGAVMPAFTWVLRDFALELADERGDAITADEYLDRSLRPQRGFEAAVLERNRVRHVLGAFFPKRQCRTLVRPVHDEAKLQQVDSLAPEELRPEFRRNLEELKDALFAPEHVRDSASVSYVFRTSSSRRWRRRDVTPPRCRRRRRQRVYASRAVSRRYRSTQVKPKCAPGSNAPVSGSAFVDLAQQFVEAINNGGVPVVSSAWDHVSQTECTHASREALQLYSEVSLDLPLDEVELHALLEKAENDALSAFDARALGDARPEHRKDLKTQLAKKTKDWRVRNDSASQDACRKSLDALYMDVVFESLQNLGKEEAGATDAAMRLEDAWSELRKRYAKDPKARGPARDRALASCLSMKWPEAAHELARRLEQRCDEAVRKEHDKLVGARAELAELEGSAAARARMLEDAQAALVSTQLEKARHEARCQAATRNLEEVQRRSDRDKGRWDDERKKLEVDLERCRAKLSVATEKVNNQQRAAEDSMRALPSPSSNAGKGGCACVVA